MTPTATYIAEENCLQLLPNEEAPLMPDLMDYNSSDDYIDAKSRYSQEVVAYNAHLATLRKIPCDASCKGLWADGQKVLEGKDYQVRPVCTHTGIFAYPNCVEPSCDDCRITAFPLVPVKREDELWEDVEKLRAENSKMRKALKAILKRCGESGNDYGQAVYEISEMSYEAIKIEFNF